MSMIIRARGLTKRYRVYDKAGGMAGALRDLLARQHRQVSAVDELDLTVEPGEIVGLLGANGAGKTTLLKLLSGLLTPSSGAVEVLGFAPSRRPAAFLRRIGFVMGNRRQLNWDLPAIDSIRYQQLLYGVSQTDFRRIFEPLVDMLDVSALLEIPVRRVSLGERMKLEFVAALIHAPEILFLDEPTLGLDLASQQRLRSFIVEHNRITGTSIVLTSHYVDDIEKISGRIVVLSQGSKIFDRYLDPIRQACADGRVVELPLTPYITIQQLMSYGELVTIGAQAAIIRLSETGRQLWAELHAADHLGELPVASSFGDLVGKLMTLEQ